MTTETRKSNLPFNYDFKVYQGNTWSRTLTYKNSAGVAVDLSTYSATFTVKDRRGGTTILTLTEASGITLNASGQIIIAMTDTQTDTLFAPECEYELKLTLAGVDTYICEGKLLVTQKV